MIKYPIMSVEDKKIASALFADKLAANPLDEITFQDARKDVSRAINAAEGLGNDRLVATLRTTSDQMAKVSRMIYQAHQGGKN